MTQEDKQLLLKDLCVRLPYGLICSIYRIDDWNVGWRDEKLTGYFNNGVVYEFYFNEEPISIDNISKIKPYLRPMESMTKEEKREYDFFFRYGDHDWDNYTIADEVPLVIDWLNRHHFDYRRLIELGLALEALEGMYV